ncbi:MAG: hypothetical protein ABIN61_00420 [candidate division WOR-3 bacterium]
MSKYRRVISAGIVILIIYFFLFSNLVKKVKENNKILLATEKKFLSYSHGEALYSYYFSLEKYLSKRLKEYIEFKTPSEGITHLLSLAKSSGLTIISILHSPVIKTNPFSYVTVDLELLGKYSEICSFLYQLKLEETRIEKIKLSRGQEGITLQLRLRLFLLDNVDK